MRTNSRTIRRSNSRSNNRSNSTSLLDLNEPADLSGIGHLPLRPKTTRKAKRKRVSVLDDVVSELTNANASGRLTLENLYELAKLSAHSTDLGFFKDFGEIQGIQRVVEYLSRHTQTTTPTTSAAKRRKGQQQNLVDPESLLVAANLTYLCIMRGPKAKDISDAFVQHGGVEIFLKASAAFVLGEKKGSSSGHQNHPDNNTDENDLEVIRYKASSAIWLALGMIFLKSGNLMTKEQHMAAIDAILDSMDQLGTFTNQAREDKEQERVQKLNGNEKGSLPPSPHRPVISPKACQHATKTLHGVYRALNYLIDHLSMTKSDLDSRRLFQRCHAVVKIPATKSRTQTKILPERYKTDDATLFLNTKILFVSAFQKGLLQTRAHFEEAVPLCVETIVRNSAKASKNARAQDRRHCVFDLMIAACPKVSKKTLETSGILGAIEATLRAEGTVKSSSKTKARELLKAMAAVL